MTGHPSAGSVPADPSGRPASEWIDSGDLLADIDFIAERWDDLLDLREPGTPRPWRQALLDPERRAAQTARDRDERSVRDPDAPGFTSAPQHIEVLDVIVDVWTALDELAELVARHVAAAELPSRQLRRVTEIAEIHRFVGLWLDTAVHSPQLDHPRLARIARRVAALKVEVTRTLGLVLAGQLLSGAVCPFCRGVTPKHPEGSAITLRVEEIATAKDATDLRPAVEAIHAVVCWNPLCDPDGERCGTRYRGRPTWPWHEWEWLAPQLIVAERAQSQPRPPAARPAGFSDVPVLPVDHAGRAGVNLSVPATTVGVASLSGLVALAQPGDRGVRVSFVGGPFHGETRLFVRLDDVLSVTQPDGMRPQLDNAIGAMLGRLAAALGHKPRVASHPVLGAYRLVTGERPHYAWTARTVSRSA